MISVNKFQKQIIDDILNGEVKNVLDFIVKYTAANYNNKGKLVVAHDLVEHTKYFILEFDMLYEKLLKENYIKVIYEDRNENIFLMANNILELDNNDGAFQKLYSIDIIPLPELQEFKDRGYKSFEQYIWEKETNQKWKLTLAAIIIPAFLNIILAGINIFLFTTERNVIIKNKDAFPKQLNVKVDDLDKLKIQKTPDGGYLIKYKEIVK